MTRNHIVHAASNLISIGLLTLFMLMFLALFFSCESAPADHALKLDKDGRVSAPVAASSLSDMYTSR